MALPLRVLICGFGPFPGVPSNPSGRLAGKLARLRRPALADLDIRLKLLPTTWEMLPQVADWISDEAPDVVLMLGVAARRKRLCVETRAVNATKDAPDALRRHPVARRLRSDAPDVLPAPVRPRHLKAALGRRVPSTLSRDAGRYMCNALSFETFTALRAQRRGTPAVFIHLPGVPKGRRAAYDAAHLAALGDLLAALVSAARKTALP